MELERSMPIVLLAAGTARVAMSGFIFKILFCKGVSAMAGNLDPLPVDFFMYC